MLIDIHAHIIPYVDDGAETWNSAIEMLKKGADQGVIALVATPHILSENDYRLEQDIISKFLELKQRVEEQHIQIDLFLGSEIYAHPDMTLNHTISTLNGNQKYFLVEFPMNGIPEYVATQFFSFIVDEKIPIIAHPERNVGFINNPMLAYEFVQRGALMQVNTLSLLGKHGDHAKSLAFSMISNNLAHFVASDCHDPYHRSIVLQESYQIVSKEWGEPTARLLFYENPKRAISGNMISISEPLQPKAKPKRSLWQRVKNLKY